MKKELFTEKGFEHTEKRFAYIHKTNGHFHSVGSGF